MGRSSRREDKGEKSEDPKGETLAPNRKDVKVQVQGLSHSCPSVLFWKMSDIYSTGWGLDHSLLPEEMPHLSEVCGPSAFWVAFEMAHLLLLSIPKGQRSGMVLSDFSKLSQTYLNFLPFHIPGNTHAVTHKAIAILTSPGYVSAGTRLHPLGWKYT